MVVSLCSGSINSILHLFGVFFFFKKKIEILATKGVSLLCKSHLQVKELRLEELRTLI